jgi:hypothetical protein
VALGLDANSPWTVWKADQSELSAEFLRVPDRVLTYVRDALDQAERAKKPLDFKRLVRRTMLPKNVLMRAAELVAYERPTIAPSRALAERIEGEEGRGSREAAAEKAGDEDDSEMSAGAV